jgi:uncharacterized protein (TIGR03000 family)
MKKWQRLRVESMKIGVPACEPTFMQVHPFRTVLLVGASLLSAGHLSADPGGPVPATLAVYLPGDAKLKVDDQATTSTSAFRRFVTPPLDRGKTFRYTLTATLLRGDEVIKFQKTVLVRPGQETVVTLGVPDNVLSNGAATEYPTYYSFTNGISTAESWRGDRLMYRYGSYFGTYPRGKASSPNVAPLSEQDPLADAGAPGLHHNR